MTTGAGRPIPSLLGGLALLLSCAALAPVFTSGQWVLPVAGTIATVAILGVALRLLRAPPALVVLGQLLALIALLTVVFTDSGVLGVLPGPTAMGSLRALLDGVGAQIAAEKPPVAPTQEMLLLVVGAVGCAAIVVDVLVVGVGAPAIAGLVLLCVVAVPASLTRSLLPWWSFVLGALAVVLLLLSDGARRTETSGPGAGAAGLRSPAAAVSVVAALACALVVGNVATGVGTAGRLPDTGNGSVGVALNPFTQLRGELGARTATPLFTVVGMDHPTYLRTVTLDRFINNQGWVVQKLGAGHALGPGMTTQELAGPRQTVTVRGQRYDDRWLPSPGVPTSLRGVDAPLQGYTYNGDAAVVQTPERRSLPPYTVDAIDPGADAGRLRQAGSPPQSQGSIDPRWRQLDGVDPRVGQLAKSIAGQAPTTFDAAVALNDYFTNPANGFSYELSAGSGGIGSDALVDFLTVSKRGFCEQYASAMAVLLRELGIATRVVLGYTPGTGDAALRTVTTDDAHSWVEVYFAGIGWVTFDPTPQSGGRAIVPAYVAQAAVPPAPPAQAPSETVATTPAAPPSPSAATAPTSAATADGPAPAATGPAHPNRSVVSGVLGAMLLALTLSAPAALRRRRRVRRLAAGTADAAWAELTDLSRDRGIDISGTETPRAAAARLGTEHSLDADARAGLDAVINAVEQQWYGAPDAPGTPLQARMSIMIAAWQRCSPLTRRQRSFPRSVVTRSRSTRPTAGTITSGALSSGRNDA